MSNCTDAKGNLGLPKVCPFDVTKQVYFVEYYKEDGTINGIDISADLTDGVLDQTFFDGKVKNIDPKLRWYPSPEVKNITDERAEDVTESFEDTTYAFIQEGSRAFDGIIVGGNPVLLGNLKNWRYKTAGYFLRDKSGNFIGKQNRDGFIDPILIQDQSFSAGFIKATDTVLQKNSIKFVTDTSENDAELTAISASMITANISKVNGLIDVIAETISAEAVTGFTVQLNTNFGGVTSKIPAEGLEVADFAVFNVTTSTYITPTSVTEDINTPGLYVFVFVAQTAADVLLVTNPISGTLAKSYDITAFNVTIP